jgi:glycosyltransferase involved in cell wall biosynthesis
MTIAITIGMCLRNCERFLYSAIDSIVEQDFPHELMEIVFVDDGSEDNTLQVIKDSVSRIDIKARIFHTDWKGLGPARQLVVNDANGRYILWVDGDEVLSKSYVREQVDFMEKHPTVGLTSGYIGFLEGNLLLNLELVQFVVDHFLFNKPKSFLWKTRKLPGTGGSTFRVEALKQVNGFDVNFTGSGEDIDIGKRIEANWSVKLNESVFYEKKGGLSTITDLLKKYYWYGTGSYRSFSKNRTTLSLYRMTPPVGFLAGFFYSKVAYKMMGQKALFALPFLFSFKMSAWWVGFIVGQLKAS